jgi:hypothetical protein
MVRHLKRMRTCHVVHEDISIEQLLAELDEQFKRTDAHFNCVYCQRGFKDKSNMIKHTRICKKHPDNQAVSSIIINEVQELKKRLKELESEKQQQITNNNIQVNQQNNIINVSLKDFGMETHGHLTKEFLNKCFADKGLVDLIENLHFDKECPENHNVRLKSKKQELMEVFSNGKWMVKDQDQTLTELIQSGYRILRMHGKTNKDHIIEEEGIDEDDYDEIIRWLETIYEDRKIQKPVKRDLIILFINNQTMLLGRDRE